jgi:hypothetical protein
MYRVLLDKLKTAPLDKKLPALYETRIYIVVLKRAHGWSTSPHPIYLWFICRLSSHLQLELPSCRFPSGFSKSVVRDMFPGHSISHERHLIRTKFLGKLKLETYFLMQIEWLRLPKSEPTLFHTLYFCSDCDKNWHSGDARGRADVAVSTLVYCLAYSSTLKMEATCPSEKSVDFQRTTRHYIPGNKTLHNHLCKNLTCYLLPYASETGGRTSHPYLAAHTICRLADL